MQTDPSKPEERHEDFESLKRAISGAIWKACKAVLVWMVPLIATGIAVLVANHFAQKELARNVASLSVQMKDVSDKLDRTDTRVAVMWYAGGWEKAPAPSNP